MYFIEWQTQFSDPPYWHFFEIDGLMVSLFHLERRSSSWFLELAKEKGLRKAIGEMARRTKLFSHFHIKDPTCPIFLDSGAYNRDIRKPTEVLEVQAKYKPDYVCHMDVVGDWRKTFKNAKITKEYEHSYDFKIYYVIQGRTISEYLRCLQGMLKIGCERFAIGNLALLSKNRIMDVILARVIAIKEIIKEKPLHLLGVSSLDLISRISKYVDSFDSSTSIRNSTRQSGVFVLDGNKVRCIRGKKPLFFECKCPVCKNFDVFTNEYQYPKGTGERRYVRFLRAIHNAFILKKSLERVKKKF
jgi:tRNA-guanine family transglycosylase